MIFHALDQRSAHGLARRARAHHLGGGEAHECPQPSLGAIGVAKCALDLLVETMRGRWTEFRRERSV